MERNVVFAFVLGAATTVILSLVKWRVDKKRKCKKLHETSQRAYEMAVGNTPLVKLGHLSELLGCTILGKCEFLNPGGSTKDRIAREIILDAEVRGDLPRGGGGTVTEGTSGSTGISLTLMARSHGHRCLIVLPDDVAKEKSNLLERFGAEVMRVPSAAIVNDRHYVNVARQLAKGKGEESKFYFADQFENPSNVKAHYRTTGPEIWRQTHGEIDAFVMGSGTGGTISGVARYLKEKKGKNNVKIFLADPPGSALAHRVNHGVLYTPEQEERTIKRHRYDTIVEGVGLSRLTANFTAGLKYFDAAFSITDNESAKMARFLLEHEGLFCGSSSAMNCCAVVKAVKKMGWEGSGRVIVTILCDGGGRHLSKFWDDEKAKIDWNINLGDGKSFTKNLDFVS